MLLSLTHIAKQYAAVDGAASPPVLRDVNLSVDAGKSLAIVGPSGSGKSTLLQIIGTLDTPTAGQVLLDGQDLTKQSPDQLALIRNEKIGFIFQSHHLLPQCTVLENVLIPTLVHAKNNGDVEARARKLLERVGLSPRLSHRPGQLSGGECQRVAVVRALINQPKLVLADEPTGALDQHTAETLSQLLIEINKEEGVTLIVVTHALPLAKRMGRVYELREGTLVEAAK
ncbi:MAG: ABC transporter ATP-binding protein [Phycisphaeraceae bacterium]